MSAQDNVLKTEGIKEQKKSCPICNKQYPENDNYCQIDGSLLQIIDADYGAPTLSKSEEEICSG